MTLNPQERARYMRHLVLPDVGEYGQERIRAARVLVVGAGGLGAPALMYLASAGVGTIGIADDDVVDLSNLQRQVLYTTGDVGAQKAPRAADRLRAMNPLVSFNVRTERVGERNAAELFSTYDVILDCTDNFGTRYLINDACVLLAKPDVFGTVYRFEGQVGVFDAGHGSCLRCYAPEPPPPDLVPGCADGGVMGALAGMVGATQALEALKIIVGAGSVLYGRLLLIDALKQMYTTMTIAKNRSCPSCGSSPAIPPLKEDVRYCRTLEAEDETDEMDAIGPDELNATLREVVLLDVRTTAERTVVDIGGLSIPLHELPARWTELDRTRRIVVYCQSDSRSRRAVRQLKREGFEDVKWLKGGLDGWMRSGRS